MSALPSFRALLADARIAAHATSARPAWLWGTDGNSILWANAAGAATLGLPDGTAFPCRAPHDTVGLQIARLGGSLAHGGQPRLERLRGVGGGLARPLLCSCARIVVAGHQPAILVAAQEAGGPRLTLAERARHLVRAVAGADEAVAVYSAQGELLHTTATADVAVGAPRLRHLGTELAIGGGTPRNEGRNPIEVMRLGLAQDAVILARFAPSPMSAPSAAAPASAVDDAAPPPGPSAQAPAQPPEDVAATAMAPLPETLQPSPAVDAHAMAAATDDDPAPDLDTPPALPADADKAADEPGPTGHNSVDGAHDPETSPLSVDVPWFARRHPLRFVWQMDSEGRFTLGSEEFSEVIGPRLASTLGRPWADVAGELSLDPENQVARAVATRDTWSGITVSWPVEGSSDRLKVEMSGLPIFDRARSFLGYRGFGVCRDIERINVLTQSRRTAPSSAPEPAEHASPANDVGDTVPAEPATGVATEAGERPALSLVPAAKNVVPFRAAAGEPVRGPALSAVEHSAFRELARQLTARLRDNQDDADEPKANATIEDDAASPSGRERGAPEPAAEEPPSHAEEAAAESLLDRALLDCLPVGILMYRFDQLIFANRAFLAWVGHDGLEAFAEAGGLDSLLIDKGDHAGDRGRMVEISSAEDGRSSSGQLFSIPHGGDTALVLVIDPAAGSDRREAEAAEAARRAEREARELAFVVETASDAVLVVDREGTVLSANRGAQSLFGRDEDGLAAALVFDLFAPESQRVVRHQFGLLTRGETSGPVTDGREVAAHTGSNHGGSDARRALFMTIGRIGDSGEKFCLVLRDITAWKTQEHELVAARLQAERASRAKSDFLAKISHEVRTPLNSIIGFSDVMIEERFGPIGNERYRDYLKDIRASGEHVVALLNDLLDLAKIEAGKLELDFVAVNLNEMIQACVMLMQPQANREHIIIRTSLIANVKPVIADAKSVRQIVLNLLSNSIKFTGSGGQVIVSTAHGEDGAAVMRVRDTGIGMSESDLAAALEPFRQLATAARWGSSGTGLGLPLTKALVEANRATFAISSKINEGTLVEVTFPASRVASE